MLKLRKRDGGKNYATSITKNDRKKIISPDSPFAVKEAYNSIRTKLMFTAKGEKCPVFIVTSPEASDGKSLNAINIAVSFAQTGKRTLIIDADMRNPSLGRYLNIPRENGLSELLAGMTEKVDVKISGYENLFVLTSGSIPPNPAELLMTPQMKSLIDFVQDNFDCVFIDTPPVCMVSDATMLTERATGYIMVVKNGSSDTATVREAVGLVSQLEGKIVGFLLNDAEGRGAGYYKNGYYNKKGYYKKNYYKRAYYKDKNYKYYGADYTEDEK